jgi:hypothetical protein
MGKAQEKKANGFPGRSGEHLSRGVFLWIIT